MAADKRLRRRIKHLFLGGIVSGLLTATAFSAGASAATPEYNIEPGFTAFSLTPSTSQAGGHPDVEFVAEFATTHASCDDNRCALARVLKFHFPAGFIGNPHVAPRCTLTEFSQASCPVDSQIGVFETNFSIFVLKFPAYNMETAPDQAGLIATTAPLLNVPIFLELAGRTDTDYGLDSISTPLLRIGLVDNIRGHLWGVPADPVHNPRRFVTPLVGAGSCQEVTGCYPGEGQSPTFAPPTVPEAPFLENPTTCGVSLTASADLEYYGGGAAHAETPWPAGTGCGQLAFNPSLGVEPTTSSADTASGLDIDLNVPQTQTPNTPSPSEIRSSTITLPEGFSINPNAADGKLTCTGADTSIGTLLAARCPEYSRVGTTLIDVAALPAPIQGGVYLLEPQPGDRYRLLITADGFATHVKVIASIRPDPQTGRLVTVVDFPQSNIQEVLLHLFGSERGLLATPPQCGTYSVDGEFVPWDSALTPQVSTSYFRIDSGPGGGPCPSAPRPFAPRLRAGTSNNTAAAHAPFGLTLTRDDGDQALTGLKLTTPPGFLATAKGIPYCPEAAIARLQSSGYSGLAEQAASSCPAASQVGTSVAGAGAGSHPLYVSGKVYWAGPYKGAPLSLVAVTPAVSGPYDLGNVVVRVAIQVDPRTAQVTATADPFPRILEGIPLRIRFLEVDLDRPGFTLNPTNCDPFAFDATLFGDEGSLLDRSELFQVANCAELPYRPKLSLRLTGGVRRLGHPAIHAVLTARPGLEANTHRVAVTLPAGELLDNSHIGTVCTRVSFAQNACPPGSRVGRAVVTTPLLDQPLRGSAYLRSSSHDLPDLVLDLEGQFEIEAAAHIDSVNGRLRATFESVPDAPVSRIALDLLGGHRGLLQNSESLCLKPKRAAAALVAQNAATASYKVPLKTECGSPRAGRSSHHRHPARRFG